MYIGWGVTAEKLAERWGPQNATGLVNGKTRKKEIFLFPKKIRY